MYYAKYYQITKVITWCAIGIVVMMMVGLLTGCTATKYVEVEKVRTDTVYQSKILKDSVWLHDSVFVKEYTKGDTVFRDRDRWHTKYIVKQVHDTTYVAKRDSIPVPYEVIKEVPKKLNWLQTLLIWSGGLSICAIIIFLIIKFKKFLPF